jgi:fructose-specific phosphotransferase system IIA component
MKISDYLKDKGIILDISASTKVDAIRELAQCLKGNPKVKDLDRLLHDTFEREKFSTTGIGHETAIPHARTEAVTGIVICFGRPAGGIDFDSFDGKPVRLVFLMGTPKGKNLSTYLNVLARLTRLLENESFRRSLLEAQTKSEIIAAFKAMDE